MADGDLERFYRDREMRDRASRATTAWEIERARMANPGEAFASLVSELELSDPPAPLRFYEGDAHPDSGVSFQDRFPQATTARIGYVVEISNPFHGLSGGPCPCKRVLRDAQGRVVDQQPFIYDVVARKPELRFYDAIGPARPGRWPAGEFAFEIYMADLLVARAPLAVT